MVGLVFVCFLFTPELNFPSGYKAYEKAESYMKKKAPFGTQFIGQNFGDSYEPFSQNRDGSVFCHFYYQLPGETNVRNSMVVVTKFGPFWRVKE